MSETLGQRTDQRIDEIMGMVLRTGVVLAALVVFGWCI